MLHQACSCTLALCSRSSITSLAFCLALRISNEQKSAHTSLENLSRMSLLSLGSYLTLPFPNYFDSFCINRSVLLRFTKIIQLERTDVERRVLFESVRPRLVLESECVPVSSSGGEVRGIRDFGREETRGGVERMREADRSDSRDE